MENIGRYRILKELGRGAGGVVYLAEDPKIGRKVAIKTISVGATGAAGETLRKRLQREARSAGSLAHPNIVTVFELDDDGPFTFVVMEFVEGVTLRDVMSAGEKMASERTLMLLRQVADGLDFAHARAVVHRDIKPANIMVTTEEVVKIADFGVAKMLGDATMGLTQAGMAIGTPHYMSPEQVLGKPVTGQSDQFSLAVIAYELLAGSRPFEGDSITSIMYQIVNEDPAPGMEGADFNSPVFTVLMRALAKEPVDRYATCAQMVSDLREAVLFNRAPAPVASPAFSAPPPAPAVPAVERAPAAPEPMTQISPEPVPEPPPVTPSFPEAPAPAARSNGKWLAVAAILIVLVAAGIWLALHKKSGEEPVASTVVTNPAPAPEKRARTPKPSALPVADNSKAAGGAKETAAEQPPKQPAGAIPASDATPSGAKAADTTPGVHGTFSWSGLLAAGDSLEVVDGQPASGSVNGRMPPRRAAIRVLEVDPPDVGVDQLPAADNGYTLRLVNSGRDVSNFSVTWRVARKGESTTE